MTITNISDDVSSHEPGSGAGTVAATKPSFLIAAAAAALRRARVVQALSHVQLYSETFKSDAIGRRYCR